MDLVSADFEVFGKVQGCNFPKVAKDQADSLGVFGWIKNTKTGSILGRIQGTEPACAQMERWLSEEGSPGSMIERCDITNKKKIVRPDYQKFKIAF
ncbi:acylphosphatase-2 [Hyalella azteca]|uniref:acylphosphatase n=1 Tax=Hyalella azteca TaxID=294128 RepID=A0A8B7P8Q5_HYAAZ|nr:acylphosphatase-2 [Hyalella azteca]